MMRLIYCAMVDLKKMQGKFEMARSVFVNITDEEWAEFRKNCFVNRIDAQDKLAELIRRSNIEVSNINKIGGP